VIDTAALKTRFEALTPFLGEREWRLWAASEAYAAGRGGIMAVSAVTGIARDTSRSPASTSPQPNSIANGTTPSHPDDHMADAIVSAQALSLWATG